MNHINRKRTIAWSLTALGFVGLVLFAFIRSTWAASATWTETQPAGNTNKYWGSVASDSDGSNLIAAGGNEFGPGRLYLSTNGGSTWTETFPAGATDKTWASVASDADGSNLIAAATAGRVYTSDNGGASWTERTPAGSLNRFWTSVASDATGTHLIAAASSIFSGGRLYTSADGGVSWTERQPAGNVDTFWRTVASDADGSNLLAAVWGGRLYQSSDSGTTWTETQPAGNVDTNWISVDSDDDGTNLIAGVNNGRLYVSSNSGVSWTETQPAGNLDAGWIAVASDDNGSSLIAAIGNENLYVSSDGGLSWTATLPAGITSKYWSSVASDGDGSNLMAAVGYPNAGRLYVGAATVFRVMSAVTADADTDGMIDTVLVNFSAPATDSGSYTVGPDTNPGLQVVGYDVTALVGSSTETLSYSLAESGLSDINATPALSWTTGSYTDSGGVTLGDTPPANAVPMAVPPFTIPWSETQPAGNVDEIWKSAASDADGSNLITLAYNGRVYISSNGGGSWTETQPVGNTDQTWYTTASDADGSNLMVASYAATGTGRVYLSSNGGLTWTETQPAGNTDQFWSIVASDADGSHLLAGVYTGRLYVSSNGGLTWTETQPAGNVNGPWFAAAWNADGSKLIVAGIEGRLYTSVDGGTSWTERQPAGDNTKFWQSVASDSTGTRLVAATGSGPNGGGLYISFDSGATWTEREPAGTYKNWKSVGMDSTGTHILAGLIGGGLYASEDSGSHWTEQQPAGNVTKDWYLAAVSGDASHYLAGAVSGRLYRGYFAPPAPPLTVVQAATADSDTNGQMDQVVVNFSGAATDNGTYNAGTDTNPGLQVSGYDILSVTGNSSDLLTYTLAESGSPDMTTSPSLTWQPASYSDSFGQPLSGTPPATATPPADATPPSGTLSTPAATVNADWYTLHGTLVAESGPVNITVNNGAGEVASTSLSAGETSWYLLVPLPQNAGTTFTVNGTDAANNSASFGAVTLTETASVRADNRNPPAPRITTSSAIVHADTYTLTGRSRADQPRDTLRVVRIYNGSDLAGTVLLASGVHDWTLEVALAQDAANVFTATATDVYGNVSPVSNTVTITESSDETAPVLVSSLPASEAVNVPTIAGRAILTWDETLVLVRQADITITRVSDGSSVKRGRATVSGNALTVDYRSLRRNTRYRITVGNNALADLVGNGVGEVNLYFTTGN